MFHFNVGDDNADV